MRKKKLTRRFAQVERDILHSAAWKKPTHAARVVYLHLRGEFNGHNRDSLKLPYSGTIKDIMTHGAFLSGISQLDEFGFIDVVRRGGRPSLKDGRPKSEANIYKLSDRWRIYGGSISEFKEEHSNRVARQLHQEYCQRQEEVERE